MEKLVALRAAELAKLTRQRSGEVRFGEKMLTVPKTVDPLVFMSNCEARFVLFGIPEDIGIRANSGRPGAASAWQNALESIANLQHNKFCKGSDILALGHLDVSDEMRQAETFNFAEIDDRLAISKLVQSIDKEVSHLIFSIVKAGKIPIIVGGGQNNAYGNIKGTALAKGKPVNAINFDSQSDFRILEGRHNGNAFHYAFEEGFLKKYFIFGLHENYVSKNVLQNVKKLEGRIQYTTYDEISIRAEKDFDSEMHNASRFISSDAYGIEIDLDAIPDVASSTMTYSGFSVAKARRFVHFFAKHKNAAYLHICEGAPDLGDEKNKHLIGKLIGYLLTDFIKAKNSLDN
ncbi:formimidoylglutamase [Flavobacterium sp.]|uniref:formimidoylglutamase n=1 Tax=Flavobacterium sp. TaxID=239 RepID=UPI001200225D|nr:formimidoylglutamase [Flavobacterium sp.]RZJ70120.1 MAG: arginase [Flavobacterium sp.]